MSFDMARTHIRKTALFGLAAGAAMLAGGCVSQRGHQGYIVDPTLVAAVQPGVDNRASVERTLGRPTFIGQFDNSEWYYVSRSTKQLAFSKPKPTDQTILRVRFDAAGNVAAVDQAGMENVVNIDPEGDETPTLGRDRSFFQELFGNIGSVSAPLGQGGGNDPTRP